MKIPPTLQERGSHQDVTMRILLESKVDCAPYMSLGGGDSHNFLTKQKFPEFRGRGAPGIALSVVQKEER